jgi:GGDEF domain-containing protein
VTTAFQATVTFAPAADGEGARASRLPAWARRFVPAMGRLPAELADRSTGLYHRAGLIAAANRIVGEQAPGAPFAMIVVEFTELREICDIYGNGVARKVVATIVRRMRSIAGWRGVAGRTGPAQFTIVLPAADDKACRRVRRVLGTPARVEFDAGDSEIVLVPDVIVDAAETGDQAQDLYRDMCRELARRQKDERRRLHWLASERERHSRPMSLPQR